MTEEAQFMFNDDEISDFRKIIDAETSLLIADKFNKEKNTYKYSSNRW